MEDIFMNANASEEVVQPQEETQGTSQEVVSPEDMSSADFMEHIKGLKDGTTTPRSAENTQAEASFGSKAESEEATEPFKIFETEADFQGFMDKAIGNRLKNARAEKEMYENYGKRAMNFYGGENYADAIGKMIDDVETQFLENSGKTRQEFEEEMRLKMDADSYRRQVAEEDAREQAIKAIQEEWAKEEQSLKRVIPSFDLEKAMENPEFKNLVLGEGMSLSAAYISLTNKNNTPAPRPQVTEIGNSRGRVGNLGAKRPEEMSREDFAAYIKRIKESGG